MVHFPFIVSFDLNISKKEEKEFECVNASVVVSFLRLCWFSDCECHLIYMWNEFSIGLNTKMCRLETSIRETNCVSRIKCKTYSSSEVCDRLLTLIALDTLLLLLLFVLSVVCVSVCAAPQNHCVTKLQIQKMINASIGISSNIENKKAFDTPTLKIKTQRN